MLRFLGGGALVILFSWSCVVAADEDAHDKLVYGRYAKKIGPCTIRITYSPSAIQWPKGLAELDHPATKKDVEAGRAIFTFEGLGESRVWKLPDLHYPVLAEWPALTTPRRVGSGYVLQAEELKVNGQWKRYFGFICDDGAVVVPATEMEIGFLDWPWFPSGEFFAEIDWGITVPGPKMGYWKRQEDPTVKVTDPLPLGLFARNVKEHSQEIPAEWYRDAQHGGPALLEVVRISLSWAPFDAKYPIQRPFVAIEPIRDAHFPNDGKKRVLPTDRTLFPGNAIKLFDLDLHDWFKVEKEGYYNVALDVDYKSLGLHDEFEDQHRTISCLREFHVGKEPKRPTIAEYNRIKPALGGKANEERLLKSIHDTVARKKGCSTEDRQAADALMPWSQPEGGLISRIEQFTDTYCGFTILLRLKNVSGRPLTVPMGNPLDPAHPRSFELYMQRTGEPWQITDWFAAERNIKTLADLKRDHGDRSDDPLVAGNRRDREQVVLKPGETCLAYLCGNDYAESAPRRVQMAETIKVVLRQPKRDDGSSWSGVLETPPRPAHASGRGEPRVFATQPIPDYFPAMTYARGHLMNEPGFPFTPDVYRLRVSNGDLLEVLQLYEAAGVAVEFEKRTLAEKDPYMKLLLAAIAAAHGSEKAALFLLERLKDTDFGKLNNTYRAIASVLFYCHGHLPEWVEELLLASLSDERFVTGEESRGSMEIRQMADLHGDFSTVLGQFKCRKAVPVLIEIARRDRWTRAIHALGEIGDPRDSRPN